ncbi:MAG: hypothetical protein ACTSYA_07875 [Candidatus Kariarchaeaceae archaeon]
MSLTTNDYNPSRITIAVLLAISILGSIGYFFEANFLILAFSGFGLLIGFLIYKRGYLNIKIPREYIEAEKDREAKYYHTASWSEVKEDKYKFMNFSIALIIFWLVVAIFISALTQIQGEFGSDVEEIIEYASYISWIGIGVIVLVIYLSVVGSSLKKPKHENYADVDNFPDEYKGTLRLLQKKNHLPDELITLFTGKGNLVIIIVGVVAYFFGGLIGLMYDIITIEGIIAGLFFLPMAVIVSRITGKFFYLFAINQYSQAKNWSILDGKKIRSNEKKSSNLKGLSAQFQAWIAVILIVASIFSSFFAIIRFLIGEAGIDEGGGLSKTLLPFLPDDNYGIILVLLTLGPLLALLTRPFNFVNVWMNQGLYEKIGSSWDIDTRTENVQKYYSLFRIPQRLPGFRVGLFIASGGILSLISIQFCASLTIIDSEMMNYILQGIILINFINPIIFFMSFYELSRNMEEEKTLMIFAKESRRAEKDLINLSLYGEHLLVRRKSMEKYLEINPENWGLAWVLKGRNDLYEEIDRILALEEALSEEKIHLPAVKPSIQKSIDKIIDMAAEEDIKREPLSIIPENGPGFLAQSKVPFVAQSIYREGHSRPSIHRGGHSRPKKVKIKEEEEE